MNKKELEIYFINEYIKYIQDVECPSKILFSDWFIEIHNLDFYNKEISEYRNIILS